MSTVTITITEDTGPVSQPDDIQGVGTIASFRDGVAAAACIGTKPPDGRRAGPRVELGRH
jgi:hypothetical protein